VDVIAKLLDEAMVPTAECVANLESAAASATQELAAFREDAAARREAESKVCPMTLMRSFLLRFMSLGCCLEPGFVMPAPATQSGACIRQVIEARKKHEASAQEERKNAIAEWLDLLASQVPIITDIASLQATTPSGSSHAWRLLAYPSAGKTTRKHFVHVTAG
jgi:hypothetical protein